MQRKSKQELITFYSKTNLRQHEKGHELKAPDKIAKVLEITVIKKEDFILDIGCARGGLVYRLTTCARCGIGIDIARNILKRARKSEKIRYVQADAEYIPFDDNVFSKIICLDLLEHVLNPEKVLIEIKRVLKENGEIIIEVPTTGFLSSLLTGDFYEGHLRYYTVDRITEDLSEVGLIVKNLELFNSVPFSTFLTSYKTIFRLFDSLVNCIPNRMYPWFGGILIKGIKIPTGDSTEVPHEGC